MPDPPVLKRPHRAARDVPPPPVESDSTEISSEPDSSDMDDGKARKKHKPLRQVKRSKTLDGDTYDGSDDEGSSSDVADQDTDEETGIKVVGRIAKAPTKGLVPPGHISRNTLKFLAKLAIPENNDRQWFALHDPVFRQAQKEFVDFVDILVPGIMDIDQEIPFLPARDIIHRIYRDVRFSNDKTPYKKNFSVSLSRTGRKGIFGHYHLSIKPGDQSILAVGVWEPGKEELALIRQSMADAPKTFRRIISAPEFVAEFGEPSPLPAVLKPKPKAKSKGKKKGTEAVSSSEDENKGGKRQKIEVPLPSRRRNVFGGDRELKVAPMGYPKDHPEIDLLKLRSIAVIKHYTDEQVTQPDFQKEILRVMAIARPLVHQFVPILFSLFIDIALFSAPLADLLFDRIGWRGLLPSSINRVVTNTGGTFTDEPVSPSAEDD
ncbi:Conserved hypothetical protein CHP02453 [Phaffia rhodozyma]|uniref:Uncharacterized protein n=1 Tax=Phaffia rhodozyma TaxID=264483 RepID=A0A0F7SRU0_PHARH|nr:Conserved hypothetical protein CHP02453 [Phaffia rhodozyma]